MFYNLLYPLRDYFFGFNVFKYITFRSVGAAVTSFLISIMVGPWLINRLKSYQVFHSIKKEGFSKLYDQHGHKETIPTMGGILILFSVVLSTLLWADITNTFVLWSLFGFLWCGGTGVADDCVKLFSKKAKGISGFIKLLSQAALGVVIGWVLYRHPEFNASISVPFLKDFFVVLGPLYILFVVLVIVGSSNAVNLSDGLDGLAAGCVVLIALTYAVLSYVAGHLQFSRYLQIPYVSGAGELAVFCSSILGAGMGFLWFNCYPASVFMGDTGSLSLGGALGIVAVFIRKEILLVMVAGVFVIEALSVILQVGSYKLRKKRIFKMAPLHHHFQLQGWPESKVVIRFWILAIIFSLMGLATLKLQ